MIEDGPGQLHAAIGADTPPPERAVVLDLIGELPAPQKEAVFLAYFGGMTHDEIAAWSHAPLGTVKGRIRMGLQKIRTGLEEQEQARCARPSAPAAPQRRWPSSTPAAAVAPRWRCAVARRPPAASARA